MFRNDSELAEPARIVSSLTRDVTELMSEIGLKRTSIRPGSASPTTAPARCSMDNKCASTEAVVEGSGLRRARSAGRALCCGSAGTYNLLQPEIARRLRDRKVANIAATSPDLIAAGNIGCLTQIASGTKAPVVHTVELLDWATGGPRPKASGA